MSKKSSDMSNHWVKTQTQAGNLLLASTKGKLEEVQRILNETSFDTTVLSIVSFNAIKNKRTSILHSIITISKVDVNQLYKPDCENIVPLIVYAISKENVEVVKVFVKYGYNVKNIHKGNTIEKLIHKKFKKSVATEILASNVVSTKRKTKRTRHRQESFKHVYTPLGFEGLCGDDGLSLDSVMELVSAHQYKQPRPRISILNAINTNPVDENLWKLGLHIDEIDILIEEKQSSESIDKGIDGITMIYKRRDHFQIVMKHPDFVILKMLFESKQHTNETDHFKNEILKKTQEFLMAMMAYWGEIGKLNSVDQKSSNEQKLSEESQKKQRKDNFKEFFNKLDSLMALRLNLFTPFMKNQFSKFITLSVLLKDPFIPPNTNIANELKEAEDVFAPWENVFTQNQEKNTNDAINEYSKNLLAKIELLSTDERKVLDMRTSEELENKLSSAINEENLALKHFYNQIPDLDNGKLELVGRIFLLQLTQEILLFKMIHNLISNFKCFGNTKHPRSHPSETIYSNSEKISKAFKQVYSIYPPPIKNSDHLEKIITKTCQLWFHHYSLALSHSPEFITCFKNIKYNDLPKISIQTDNFLSYTYATETNNFLAFPFNSPTKVASFLSLHMRNRVWNHSSLPPLPLYGVDEQTTIVALLPPTAVPIVDYLRNQKVDNPIKLIGDIVDALLFLQTRGIVHGFITPQSIYVIPKHPPHAILVNIGITNCIDYTTLPSALKIFIDTDILEGRDVPSLKGDLRSFGRVIQHLLLNCSRSLSDHQEFLKQIEHMILLNNAPLRKVVIFGFSEYLMNGKTIEIAKKYKEMIENEKRSMNELQQSISRLYDDVLARSTGKEQLTPKSKAQLIKDIQDAETDIQKVFNESVKDQNSLDIEFEVDTQPTYWRLSIMEMTSPLFYSTYLKTDKFQKLFNQTGGESLIITSVVRIENSVIWESYRKARTLIYFDDRTSLSQIYCNTDDWATTFDEINENICFMALAVILGLTENTFTLGPSGYALYLSDSPLTEYENVVGGGEMTMVLVRCVLGNCWLSPVDPDHQNGVYHSCYTEERSNMNVSKEFAVFQPYQCYPEYVITYKKK
ncbi:hypothetical protein QTN25_006702 [Entamoeba marina]